jgi:hypothetical protein
MEKAKTKFKISLEVSNIIFIFLSQVKLRDYFLTFTFLVYHIF